MTTNTTAIRQRIRELWKEADALHEQAERLESEAMELGRKHLCWNTTDDGQEEGNENLPTV